MTSNPWDATQHHAGKHTGSNTFGSNQTENEPATTPVPILEITITLGPDDPAIVPLTHKLHGTDHAEGLPTAEILFDFDAPTTPRAFAVLRDIQFDHLLVQAQADRIKNLKILADGAEVDSAKPFEPFGTRPRIGTPFHIGSSEIFSKSIKTWKLHLEWENPYYTSGYFYSHSASIYNPTEWVLTGGKWELADPPKTVTTSEGYSYSTLAGEADLKINYSVVDVELASGELIDGQAEQFIENPGLDSKSRNGFLRMSLPADFGHNLFSDHKAMALVAKAGGDAYAKPSWVNVSSTSTLPNEPFVPVLSAISASYVTNLETAQSHSLLYPFGQTSGTSDRRLFPEFPYESALCIGIDAFNAPARLNLLVQVLDGSGDPLIPSPPLGFEYLSDTGWQKLLPQDVDDKTANFTTSAVLGLNLPEVLNRSYPEMPTDLYWVRISSQENSAAMNQLLQITAQAAVVSFRDTGNDPMFLATPLPAGTIAKPKIPDPLVKKITQPFSSFGGRPAEPDATFYTRVSERLRHKDRAITIWDYEALVLQQFPKLFRAKCLPTTALKRDAQSRIIADNENMPGAVTLVTVPWTHDQNSRDPLRPYTDQATLHAVDTFLRQRISPFVRLEVQNPKFEEIQLQFNVRFRPEIGDIAFYTEELNKALVAYLSPWSQPEGGEITFGGNLWKSSVIDFVDEWPHVDFVTDFQMFHKVDVAAPDGSWTPIDSEVIEATTARSILVSAASHKINEVPGNG